MASTVNTYLEGFGYKEWWEFMTNTITRSRRAEYPDSTEAGPQLSAFIATATTPASGTTLANMCDAFNTILSDFHQQRNEVLLWLNEECGCGEEDYPSEYDDLSSAASSDSDDAVLQVTVPWDFDREEEALLSNYVYLWRRENGVGDSLQLTFDNDSSSPDLESMAGLQFTIHDCCEYFTPYYTEQLQRFNNLNTWGAASIASASSAALPVFRTATCSSALLALPSAASSAASSAAFTDNTHDN